MWDVQVKEVQQVQEWLRKYIDSDFVREPSFGICSNILWDTGTTMVSNLSHNLGAYVIDDVNSGLTKQEQYYRYAELRALHEGKQLELRKEYAQMCIEYFDEVIRI